MTAWRKVTLVALAVCALAGCNTPEPPRRARGLATGENTPRGPTSLPASSIAEQPSSPSSAPPASSLPSPFMGRAPDPGSLATRDAAPDKPIHTEDPDDAGPTRDLAIELKALLGQPATCLDLAAVEAAGGKLTVQATAHVMPSGRITRASISATGQPPSALRCLEQRITNSSLKGPIPDAPREVNTQMPVEIISQPATRTPASP